MKTVYAFIEYQGNSLAVDFPLDIYDMPDHLGSIGIHIPVNKVTVAETKDVSVKLTGLNEVGEAIVDKVADSDSLFEINKLCHAVEEVCLLGYEDMAERLSSSDAECVKEMITVVEGFTQQDQSQMMDYPYLVAYVYSKEERTEHLLKATPENIASFIVKNSPLDIIQITTPYDTAFLSTRAGFIDYCRDQEFLTNELLPVLVPMQLGEVEPPEVELFAENNIDIDDEAPGFFVIKLY